MELKMYYHPRFNILGFNCGLGNIIKIDETRQFMVLTKEWIEIGII